VDCRAGSTSRIHRAHRLHDWIHDGASRFYYSYDAVLGALHRPTSASRESPVPTTSSTDAKMHASHRRQDGSQGGPRHRGSYARRRRIVNFVSFIGPEPQDYAIMPSTVRFGPKHLFTAIRRRHWIDSYRSFDDGESWQFVNQPVIVTGGNPPCLTKLADGRLVLTYGYREKPYGVRAKISNDQARPGGRSSSSAMRRKPGPRLCPHCGPPDGTRHHLLLQRLRRDRALHRRDHLDPGAD
jgi:hypothetical protein